MVDEPASPAVNEAHRLRLEARPGYDRYARILLLFAAGAFFASLAYGAIARPLGPLVSIALWAGTLIALLLHYRREKLSLRRFATLHGMLIATWAGLWVITVVFGSMMFADRLTWWVGGGVACALPGIVGAVVVYRATR